MWKVVDVPFLDDGLREIDGMHCAEMDMGDNGGCGGGEFGKENESSGLFGCISVTLGSEAASARIFNEDGRECMVVMGCFNFEMSIFLEKKTQSPKNVHLYRDVSMGSEKFGS